MSAPALPVQRESWADWSDEREQRRIEHNIEERRKAIEKPIYPREIAAAIAEDAARLCIPDWRHVRNDHRALFVNLLKEQPELQQREVRQLDSVLRLIGDNLPAHLQPLIQDIRRILEFRILAHETGAFLVGIETGRRLERQYIGGDGTLHTRRPPSVKTARGASPLRLHAGDNQKGGAR